MTQHTPQRFRRKDFLALFGLIAMSIGAALFIVGMEHTLIWLAWLIAPLLWYLGFGIVVAWAVGHILATGRNHNENDSKIRHWIREKLINAAGKVFAEVGFDGATVRDICSRARINEAAIDDHFGDKLGLYTEVLRTSMFAQQEPALNSSLAHPSDPRAALRALIHKWFERMREGGRPAWFAPIMAREMAQPTPALDRVAKEMGANYLRFRTLVGELIGRDPNDARTRMCVHSVVGQILHYAQSRPMLARLWPDLNLDDEGQRRAIADQIVSFSLAGIESIAWSKAIDQDTTLSTTMKAKGTRHGGAA